MKDTALIGIVILAGAAPLSAAESSQDVYVSTGAHGETVFSDVARPGAQRIVVEAPPRQEDAMAELERRIEQTLMVANDLQESRLAREAARAEARERATDRQAAQAPPQVVYEDRYVGVPYPLRAHRQRGFHHDRRGHGDRPNKPPHRDGKGPDRGAEEPESSRPFLWHDD
ncbi:MAG: hypothetical protein U5Q16_12045 [Gammaproteobacteria bacterium]|nr:hypothetical protein [Gammaproteobacteria bacterium]